MSINFIPFARNGLSLALLSIISSASAEVTTTETQKKLETVFISATRSETSQLPVATQIKVIDSDEIRVSGAKLLSDVLRTQAGIQLTDADGSGSRNVSVSMRGLSGSVLVMVDGRKLNNPSVAAPALNTIALKDVARIEIMQGSAGVLYGDQAIAGVINIITHRAVAGEVDGSVSATQGSHNLEDYSLSLRQGFANGLSYSASAQKRNADNYRDNNQTAYENALANVRYDAERGFVFIEGQKVDDNLRLPGGLSDQQVQIDRRQSSSPDDYNNQETDTLRVGGGFSLTRHWALQTEYSDRNEEGEYIYSPSLTQYSLRVKSFTPRLIGEFNTDFGQWVATLGYDKIDSEYESNNGWAPVNSTQKQDSYYAQLVYPLLPKLTSTLGVRFAEVEDANSLTEEKQDDNLHASELGLTYQLSLSWRIFGRYAENFRFGNPDDNNATLPGVNFLEPQTGDSRELGAEWTGTDAQISYSLYQMKLRDEIVFDVSRFANINLPDAERQGFMVDGNKALGDGVNLRFNYTYTDAEVIAGPYREKAVPFVAENTGSLALVFAPVKPVSLAVEAIYTGKRYKADDNENLGPKLKSVTVFNANLLYAFRQVDIGLRINNLTNERYAGYHSVWAQYPQPERNYEASLTFRF